MASKVAPTQVSSLSHVPHVARGSWRQPQQERCMSTLQILLCMQHHGNKQKQGDKSEQWAVTGMAPLCCGSVYAAFNCVP